MSNTVSFGPPLAPRAAMVERDRSLALLFVERGEPKNGVSALARELDLDRKVLERAIARQIEWARAERAAREDAPEGDSPAS